MKHRSASYIQKIAAVAQQSTCAQIYWSGRGKAPIGYVTGMALTFARSLCRLKYEPSQNLAALLGSADSGDSDRDALAYYRNIFSAKNIPTNIPGPRSLRAVYTLGIGLGMRESSGAYCAGWDQSAGPNRPPYEIEAGLFQVSFDSMDTSPILKSLYSEYLHHPNLCFESKFAQGVSCTPEPILGSGAAAQFQSFTKACPAFATEYAMVLLRILRRHFGPIDRMQAQVQPACYSMFGKIETLIRQNPAAACGNLL